MIRIFTLIALILTINLASPNLKAEEYIPPHTWSELLEVQSWARGGAYAGMASRLGYQFDFEAYQNDCPNTAIFNFGRATGTEFIKVDVMLQAINTSFALNHYYYKDETEDKKYFRKKFLEMIAKDGFEQYLLTP